MKYKCKKFKPGLTVGATYTEFMPNPNSYNACVTNDEGEVWYVPRKEFFDIVEEAPKGREAVIYISGPMTGYEDFNRASFNDAAKTLTGNGFNVLNPATLPNGLTEVQYMSICQPMVMASHCIYMLTGWSNSPGAKAELALAEKLKLKVIYE